MTEPRPLAADPGLSGPPPQALPRTRTHPASLWIGPRLSAIEHLCLVSMVRHGMAPRLYCYDRVGNVPDGVTVLDAGDILHRDRIFVNAERGSLAPFSDQFRYRMLAETDFYWVDTDMLALRPFDFTTDYFLGRSTPRVSNAVLSLPQASPTLAALNRFCERPSLDAPWLRPRRMEPPSSAGGGTVPREDLPYKAMGPLALTHILQANDESRFVLPQDAHHPRLPRHILMAATRRLRRMDLSVTFALHLYGSYQHAKLRAAGLARVPESSLLGYFMVLNGVDLTLYP